MKKTTEKDLLKSFGKHLSSVRRSMGVTQKTLALDSDMEISTISRIERGLLNPSLSTLVTIAGSLELTLQELCDFTMID